MKTTFSQARTSNSLKLLRIIASLFLNSNCDSIVGHLFVRNRCQRLSDRGTLWASYRRHTALVFS